MLGEVASANWSYHTSFIQFLKFSPNFLRSRSEKLKFTTVKDVNKNTDNQETQFLTAINIIYPRPEICLGHNQSNLYRSLGRMSHNLCESPWGNESNTGQGNPLAALSLISRMPLWSSCNPGAMLSQLKTHQTSSPLPSWTPHSNNAQFQSHFYNEMHSQHDDSRYLKQIAKSDWFVLDQQAMY